MFDKLIQSLATRAGKEYSASYRAVATVLGATLFLVGWPVLVWVCGLWGEEVFTRAVIVVLTSFLFFVTGVPWVLWAVLWQLSKGKGTPVPVAPTQELLASGPYRYCRNPMMLGFFLYLSGWAAIFNRTSSWAAAFILIVLLILEIKLIEEKELEQRFGEAYRAYKKTTPFLLPKFWV